ncbi:hypothetical protein PSGL111025_06715 [Psychrobacter glaciei]
MDSLGILTSYLTMFGKILFYNKVASLTYNELALTYIQGLL